MDGVTLKAGAVAGVSRLRNPVLTARLVMEQSPHVLLTGAGAEKFAVEHGMDTVSPDLFPPRSVTGNCWTPVQRG